MNRETHRNNVRFFQRKGHKIATTVVLLLAYLAGVSRAADQTGKLSDEKQAKIEAAISTFMASSRAPGISVAVVQDGVHRRGHHQHDAAGDTDRAHEHSRIPGAQQRRIAARRDQRKAVATGAALPFLNG